MEAWMRRKCIVGGKNTVLAVLPGWVRSTQNSEFTGKEKNADRSAGRDCVFFTRKRGGEGESSLASKADKVLPNISRTHFSPLILFPGRGKGGLSQRERRVKMVEGLPERGSCAPGTGQGRGPSPAGGMGPGGGVGTLGARSLVFRVSVSTEGLGGQCRGPSAQIFVLCDFRRRANPPVSPTPPPPPLVGASTWGRLGGGANRDRGRPGRPPRGSSPTR